MPNANGRIRPSIKKGIAWNLEIDGKLFDQGLAGSYSEAAAALFALVEAEAWLPQIINVNLSIQAPDPPSIGAIEA